MQGPLCSVCRFELHNQPSRCCIECEKTLFCLRCASDVAGTEAICPPCQEQRLRRLIFDMESKKKRLKLEEESLLPLAHAIPPCVVCGGVPGGKVKWSMTCSFCNECYCNHCYDDTARHVCVLCAVPGCGKLSKRPLPPPRECICISGHLCRSHDILHSSKGACLARTRQSCGRCYGNILRWQRCTWKGCENMNACLECNALCSVHLGPQVQCGLCKCRVFLRVRAGNVSQYGICCAACFARAKTFIECLLLRFRKTGQRWPKDLVDLLLKKIV